MTPEDLPSPDDPEAALAAVLALRRLADGLERRAVHAALAAGWSWADIAEALGVTRQAAHKRLAHLITRKDRDQ
jgi:DNA-directed RNA polymerase specialized sigma24 family protein